MGTLGNKIMLTDLRFEELALLLELGERLVSELDLEKVLELVAKTACQVVHAETLVVPIIDTDQKTFTYRAASGKHAEIILGQTFPIQEGACGWVMEHQQPLLFGEGASFELDANARWQPGMASSLLVPLVCRGIIAGGLSAMGKQGGGAFNQRDLTVLTLFANQASNAIDNAKLFRNLGEEKANLKMVLDSVAEAIYGIDLDGKCTLANSACLHMLGYASEADLIGKHMHTTIHYSYIDGSSFPLSECSLHRAILEGPQIHTDTAVFWRSDGTSFPVELWSHPKEQEGRIIGAVVTFIDITERQRNMQELALVNFAMNHVREEAYLADEQGYFHYVNEKACSVMGYHRDELLKLRVIDVDSQCTQPEQWAAIWELFKAGKLDTLESVHTTRDGRNYPVEISGKYFEFKGQPFILGLSRDITERKCTENIAEQYRTVIHASIDGFWVTDTKGRILEVNESICKMHGYSREEFLHLNISDIEVDETPEETAAHIRQMIETGHVQFEARHRRKNGTIANVEVSIQHVTNLGERLFCFIRDITRLKEHEAELSRAANFDSLTGIPNRVLLADRMSQAIAQTSRDRDMMAVCYLDLDGFKPINDTFGHEAGDQILIEVTKRIGNTIRGGDTVARLGGDEFVVLLLGFEKGEECVTTLKRMLSAIAQPITIKSKTVAVSASIGVSIYPLDDEDSDTLLRHADQAMYVAKQSGRNRFHIFDTALDKRAREQHSHLKDILHALEQGQFELHYQPKVDLRTKALVGAEALIRWRHPVRGLLSPADFLPYIENTDLDIGIGEWVMTTALAQLNHWRAEGLDIEVSINISSYHLESMDFVERLKYQLAKYPDMPLGKLQIEILETVALKDIDVVREIIESCRKIGVEFALDDFGTGYSSLLYLSGLPVDTLKIDQSFVRDMLEDKGDMAIVQGIIALARAFGRKTVAEGIESHDHFQVLRNMGCKSGQGYGIARPMPADELTKWKLT